MLRKIHVCIIEIQEFMCLFQQRISLCGVLLGGASRPDLKGLKHWHTQIIFLARIPDTTWQSMQALLNFLRDFNQINLAAATGRTTDKHRGNQNVFRSKS
jgi:hypothetical protein